jgi:hypothetical protein
MSPSVTELNVFNECRPRNLVGILACESDSESISKDILMTSFTNFFLSIISFCNVSVFKFATSTKVSDDSIVG